MQETEPASVKKAIGLYRSIALVTLNTLVIFCGLELASIAILRVSAYFRRTTRNEEIQGRTPLTTSQGLGATVLEGV